jgi:hypothetical protein
VSSAKAPWCGLGYSRGLMGFGALADTSTPNVIKAESSTLGSAQEVAGSNPVGRNRVKTTGALTEGTEREKPRPAGTGQELLDSLPSHDFDIPSLHSNRMLDQGARTPQLLFPRLAILSCVLSRRESGTALSRS